MLEFDRLLLRKQLGGQGWVLWTLGAPGTYLEFFIKKKYLINPKKTSHVNS